MSVYQPRAYELIAIDAWQEIVTFLPSAASCQLLQVAKWWFQFLPGHIEDLVLVASFSSSKVLFHRMITTELFSPRDFLRRFVRLKRLVVDLSDELVGRGHNPDLSYTAVAGALGVLLDSGAFPVLRRLEVRVVVSASGKPEHRPSTESYSAALGDVTCAFQFDAWLHQLALSVVRAVDGKKLPLLGHLRIVDNYDGVYFCNCGLAHRQRSASDQQTLVIREHLTRVLNPTDCMKSYSWWHSKPESLSDLREARARGRAFLERLRQREFWTGALRGS